MKAGDKLTIYTDGGARGNPGPAGIGVVIYSPPPNLPHKGGGIKGGGKDRVIKKIKKYLGGRTNNEAEYEAVIRALEEADKLKAQEVDLFLDSELVARQLNGLYKIKKPHIQQLYIRVQNLRTQFKRVSFTHIARSKNQLADRLVNEAIDEAA